MMARPTTSLANARHREWVDSHATITKTETVEVDSTPTYRCVLDDGTAQLDLLFLGRPTVPGLHVGIGCQVSGRVALRAGRPVLWNPRYNIDPRPANPITFSAIPELTCGTTRCPRPAARNESITSTGRFAVYLGMAAGVGKTYAMLSEAHRLTARGSDVVIGFVTTHERPQTQSLLTELEVVPAKVVFYHGARFEEMDLDAILARHPDVALVDELAHSNIPGSGRNAKRWQDVLELLEADVDVITTVNVQHIQSLADAAEQITATRVRERIPDAVLRHADHIELVDCSPEQLRRRMHRGDIYPSERVQQALNGFFRTENLSALRELTMGFLTNETNDEQPQQFRQYQPPARQSSERVLVGVIAAPGAEVLLKRAAHIATRLKADLNVAHVSNSGPHQGDLVSLAVLRNLAEQLGARWTHIQADDPAAALMRLAGELRVTQIVVGPSQRNRWREFFGGGSTVGRLTRHAGKAGIDVHVIARPSEQAEIDASDAQSANPNRSE